MIGAQAGLFIPKYPSLQYSGVFWHQRKLTMPIEQSTQQPKRLEGISKYTAGRTML